MDMKTIRIQNQVIGRNQPTFVIAEIGSNHNQSLSLAYETIDAACEAGADAVKFQSINVSKLYFNPSAEILALHKKIDFPEEWHSLLKAYCDKKGIIFFSSPTYLESIDILESINVSLYKLASAQIGTFPQLVEKVAQLGKPVILSTGLVSYAELEKVVKIFKKADNENFIILHCNSIYPTPYEKVHLPIMNIYEQMFDCAVGFSDHTADIFAPIVAVANGAMVIEKHFAITRSLPVPDAPFSLEPSEFKRMVEGIRATEKMIQASIRLNIQPEEQSFKNAILYRAFLNNDKQKGEKFSVNDVTFLRNTEGLDANEIYLFINKSFNQSLKSGSLLYKNYFI
jgi:sialic acid synthase SpsE